MHNRRRLLQSGLAALGYGLSNPMSAFGASAPGARPTWSMPRGFDAGATNPIQRLNPNSTTISIEGLPFAPWFTGDDFRDHTTIPFHTPIQGTLPTPTEDVDVAVVGGGISGLAAAYMLRDKQPVVLELRSRFGGNARGEGWRETVYSLGSAYVITPDKGSFLERFYADLGLDQVKRDSFPPDPMAFGGTIEEKYWSGTGVTSAELRAFERYGRVVRYMGCEAYPEIPLSGDPADANAVRRLDRRTFREDLEARMGMALTPLLAAGIQSYFYSSFGAGIDEISAAAGWNFVAAEEFGRWVFPGGNSHLAWTLWNGLREEEAAGQPGLSMLRSNCTVFDVRRSGDRYRVTWIDAHGEAQALTAKYVVMAGSKHICKSILKNLKGIDPEKLDAMHQVETAAYMVANVLLDAPVTRDFYDVFLINDQAFPMTPGAFESGSRPVDVLAGNYALPPSTPSTALTLYWPLPWPAARFEILAENAWRTYTTSVADDVRAALTLLNVNESAVKQVRLTRWGHALPIAKPFFIADGHAETLLRPFDERVYFANQDNWALPAVENSLLDARFVAEEIRARL